MNTLKLAIRNIRKNDSYSLINIIGLSLAFTLCLMVFSVVIEENSYDKNWNKANCIYRINTVESTKGIEGEIPVAFANLGLELKRLFPEVEASAAIFRRNNYMNFGADQTVEVSSVYMQIDALNILDLKILEGNPSELIGGKINIMIDNEFKEKYFKNENVIGKTIKNSDPLLDKNEDQEYIVTAVFDKISYNSTFRSPVVTLSPVMNKELSKNGDGYYQEQYISLKPNTEISVFTQKVNKWYNDFLSDSSKNKNSFRFQPLQDIYMNPLSDTYISGNKKTSSIYQAVAGLVLLISCINFINLYSVRTIKKVKTINLHKIMGATKLSLTNALLVEAVIIFLISSFISLIIFLFTLSPLEQFLHFSLVYVRDNIGFIIVLFLTFTLLLGLIIGFYPAWRISNVKSSEALKNKISKASNSEIWTKKTLIVMQFVVSLIVIIGLFTVKTQLNLIENSPKGLNTDNLLNIKSFYLSKNSSAIKNELLRIPGVEKVSISGWRPNAGAGYFGRYLDDPENPDKKTLVNFIGGDSDLVPILNIKLLKGRLLSATDYQGFPKLNSVDSETKILNALLTESTAKKLGVSTLGILYPGLDIIPVGIVADFHSQSFHNSLTPTAIIALDSQEYGNILIKTKENLRKEIRSDIALTLKKFYPDKFLEHEWVDELMAKNYQKEIQLSNLFTIFSIIALFISALGVTGLIYQNVEQRNKEIGIRKVLGATIYRISSLFSKEYVFMSILAIVISGPIAWYLCNLWLEDFAYKIEVQWWFFILAGLIVLVVTLITVNIQTIRAALTNPVDSLRDE